MRKSALDAAVKSLEPRAAGRPPKVADEKDEHIAELEAENGRLKTAVAVSHVREELALVMPFLSEREKMDRELEQPRGGKRGGRRAGAADAGRCETVDARRADDGSPVSPESHEPQRAQARRADEEGDGGEDDAGQ